MLLALLVTKSNAAEEKEKHFSDSTTLTLSGSIFYGHPDLSWNAVSGADFYVLNRLPVGATGYTGDDFIVTTTRYIDEGVGVVSLSSGFCQIRYVVEAFDEFSTLIATSNPVDYITTPNEVVWQTGVCYDPID